MNSTLLDSRTSDHLFHFCPGDGHFPAKLVLGLPVSPPLHHVLLLELPQQQDEGQPDQVQDRLDPSNAA